MGSQTQADKIRPTMLIIDKNNAVKQTERAAALPIGFPGSTGEFTFADIKLL